MTTLVPQLQVQNNTQSLSSHFFLRPFHPILSHIHFLYNFHILSSACNISVVFCIHPFAIIKTSVGVCSYPLILPSTSKFGLFHLFLDPRVIPLICSFFSGHFPQFIIFFLSIVGRPSVYRDMISDVFHHSVSLHLPYSILYYPHLRRVIFNNAKIRSSHSLNSWILLQIFVCGTIKYYFFRWFNPLKGGISIALNFS